MVMAAQSQWKNGFFVSKGGYEYPLVLATASAMRQFAHEHPGLYVASLPATPADDPQLNAAAEQFVGIFFDTVRQYGFEGKEAMHAVRGLFSTIHGFLMLEHAGTFGMSIDSDESFRWLIQHYVASLTVGERGSSTTRRPSQGLSVTPSSRAIGPASEE